MSRIVSVVAKENFCVDVVLENGSSITLNMVNRLSNIRFGMLADEAFFKSVSTDGAQIIWGDAVEVSLSEIMQLAQK